jgi:hypothetical protein
MTSFKLKQQEKTIIKNNLVLDLIQTVPMTIHQIQVALHFERKNYADTINRLVKSNHITEAGYNHGAKNKRAMSYLALKKEFTPPAEDDSNKLYGAVKIKLTDSVYWTVAKKSANYGTSGATLSNIIYS